MECLACGTRKVPEPHIFCSKLCHDEHRALHQAYVRVMLIGPQVKRKKAAAGTDDEQQQQQEPRLKIQAKQDDSAGGSPIIPDSVGSLSPSLSPAYGPPQPLDLVVSSGVEDHRGTRRWMRVSRACLRDLNVEISEDRYIASGASGSTYLACVGSTINCRAVVKVGIIPDHEIYNQLEAGRMGFAPQFLTPARTCGTDNADFPEVKFIVMERMDKTLKQLLAEGRATTQDARSIVDLLRRFSRAHFQHHDMKTDNIMCVEQSVFSGSGAARTWKIIDYGLAWFGGMQHANPFYQPPANTPYGWDFVNKRQRQPCHVYNGWPRIVPKSACPDWDLFCLCAYLDLFDQNRASELWKEELFRLTLEGNSSIRRMTDQSGRFWRIITPTGHIERIPPLGLWPDQPPC